MLNHEDFKEEYEKNIRAFMSALTRLKIKNSKRIARFLIKKFSEECNNIRFNNVQISCHEWLIETEYNTSYRSFDDFIADLIDKKVIVYFSKNDVFVPQYNMGEVTKKYIDVADWLNIPKKISLLENELNKMATKKDLEYLVNSVIKRD
ncbi:MAG: hypothetical protein K2X69_07560 [Silvanigrellaceae bacterium]|nr:hypothetical protein [Silvanigrellaceae bacterium]